MSAQQQVKIASAETSRKDKVIQSITRNQTKIGITVENNNFFY